MLSLPLAPSVAARLLARIIVAGDVPGHEFHGNQWTDISLFHGTAEGLTRKILQEGLTPGMYDRVFLTEALSEAESYAASSAADFARDHPNEQLQAVVFEVHVPQEEAARLEQPIFQGPPGERLFMFHDTIKPEWIRVHSRFEDGRWRALEGEHIIYVVAFVRAMRAVRHLEDVGHEFHGNQYTDGVSGVEHVRERIDALAQKMGFPSDRIEIRDVQRSFMVGGQLFREGGHYSPVTGRIVISNKSMTDSEVDSLVAHEITHDAFYKVYGEKGENYTNDVPEQRDFRAFLKEHEGQLNSQDGVTDYSKAYWKDWYEVSDLRLTSPTVVEAARETRERRHVSAFNETLAEISALKESGDDRRISPNWRVLHEKLFMAYAAVNAKRDASRADKSDVFKKVIPR